MIVEDLKMVARANLIFGLHVHIGVEDRETAIQLMNGARYFLPHLLALSANSPFWLGMETGLRSYRCKVFDKFPRTNIPDLYSSWSEFENYVEPADSHQLHRQRQEDLVGHPPASATSRRSNSASATCRCGWRRRIAIAALCQAIIAKLYRLHERNLSFRHYSRALIMENKWRAARYGLDGKMIDFGKQTEVAGAPADRRDPGVRGRRGGRTGQPRGDRLRPQDPGERQRRRPPAARLSRDGRLEEGSGLHD